jgi:hypothetical protein
MAGGREILYFNYECGRKLILDDQHPLIKQIFGPDHPDASRLPQKLTTDNTGHHGGGEPQITQISQIKVEALEGCVLLTQGFPRPYTKTQAFSESVKSVESVVLLPRVLRGESDQRLTDHLPPPVPPVSANRIEPAFRLERSPAPDQVIRSNRSQLGKSLSRPNQKPQRF